MDVFAHLSWLLLLKNKGLEADFSNFDIIEEGWGNLIKNSQLHFPPNYPKGVAHKEVKGIKVINFRLKTEAAMLWFGSNTVSILNKNDPLVLKLIRRAHLLLVLSSNSKLLPHNGVRDTLSRVNSGSLAVMIPGI